MDNEVSTLVYHKNAFTKSIFSHRIYKITIEMERSSDLENCEIKVRGSKQNKIKDLKGIEVNVYCIHTKYILV